MAIPWKIANEVGDPAISVLLLLAVAASANTGLVLGQRLVTGSLRFRLGRTEVGVAVVLATVTLLGNLASGWAIQDLTPALHNVLLRTDVLIVALLGWVLLAEQVERRFWIGTAVAGLGLVMLQGPIEDGGFLALARSGTGMAIGAAVCFSAMAIITRRYIHDIDPVAVNALRLWLSVALWFPFNPVPDFTAIPGEQILYSTLAAIFGPFLGRLMLMISARHVEARITTLATLTTPVMTLVLAFVLLADWPAPNELVGGAIMIAGIAIPLLRARRGPV